MKKEERTLPLRISLFSLLFFPFYLPFPKYRKALYYRQWENYSWNRTIDKKGWSLAGGIVWRSCPLYRLFVPKSTFRICCRKTCRRWRRLKFKVRFSPHAKDDKIEIKSYLSKFYPTTPKRFTTALKNIFPFWKKIPICIRCTAILQMPWKILTTAVWVLIITLYSIKFVKKQRK